MHPAPPLENSNGSLLFCSTKALPVSKVLCEFFFFFFFFLHGCFNSTRLCSYARNDQGHGEVRIALVGKYTKLEDSYMSVTKALKHASLYCRRRLEITVSEK